MEGCGGAIPGVALVIENVAAGIDKAALILRRLGAEALSGVCRSGSGAVAAPLSGPRESIGDDGDETFGH